MRACDGDLCYRLRRDELQAITERLTVSSMLRRSLNRFQRCVLIVALGLCCFLSIVPPWIGREGTFSSGIKYVRMGHYPVFFIEQHYRYEITRIDWVTLGCEAAALTFLTLLLLFVGSGTQVERENSTTASKATE